MSTMCLIGTGRLAGSSRCRRGSASLLLGLASTPAAISSAHQCAGEGITACGAAAQGLSPPRGDPHAEMPQSAARPDGQGPPLFFASCVWPLASPVQPCCNIRPAQTNEASKVVQAAWAAFTCPLPSGWLRPPPTLNTCSLVRAAPILRRFSNCSQIIQTHRGCKPRCQGEWGPSHPQQRLFRPPSKMPVSCEPLPLPLPILHPDRHCTASEGSKSA